MESDASQTPLDGDVLVLAQKAVSKAERRVVDLSTVNPSVFAYTVVFGGTRTPAAKVRPKRMFGQPKRICSAK